jgi:hypothetical protein
MDANLIWAASECWDTAGLAPSASWHFWPMVRTYISDKSVHEKRVLGIEVS